MESLIAVVHTMSSILMLPLILFSSNVFSTLDYFVPNAHFRPRGQHVRVFFGNSLHSGMGKWMFSNTTETDETSSVKIDFPPCICRLNLQGLQLRVINLAVREDLCIPCFVLLSEFCFRVSDTAVLRIS